MKIEKIRKINKSMIIIGGLIGLGVIGAISILPSFAKYKTTQSFNLVNGKITYKEADMNVIAMKQSEDGKTYIDINKMPSSGYVINESQSYCNLNGQKDSNVVLKTIYGEHIMQNITKGDKCYLYFDKANTLEQQKALAKPSTSTTFTTTSTADEGLYSIPDPVYGRTTYYYRGAVTNNYVVFANKCWRLIRINGNGSIRLILDSNDATCKVNGSGENATTSQKYNSVYNDSAYVGYMKGINDTGNSTSYDNAHTNSYDSDIKKYLDGWYDTNIDKSNGSGKKYSDYIDEEAGFCNDRTLRSGYSESSAFGTGRTSFASSDRIQQTPINAQPTLGCTNTTRDLFTPSTSSVGNKKLGTGTSRPIGLITADEVVFAGTLFGSSTGTNKSYYLYNATSYWTMTPAGFDGKYASVLYVDNAGSLSFTYLYNTNGVRPVINLKSTTTFTGNGTQNNPYVVE